MLVVGRPEHRLALFTPVKLMAFERLDQCGCLSAAGSLHGFNNLRHRGIPQVAPRGGRMIVLVDDTLDEPLGTLHVDLGIPDQTPYAGVAGITERTADLLATDQSADADLFLG